MIYGAYLRTITGCQQEELVEIYIDSEEPISDQSVDMMHDIEQSTTASIEVEIEEEESVAALGFGVNLAKASYEGDNVLLSPISLLYALGMTANGAEGETLTQMESVLGMDAESLNQYLYAYRGGIDDSGDENEVAFHLANAIWFTDDEKLTVNDAFLQTNGDYYQASIYEAPFNETTLEDINTWVYRETDGMITDILDQIPENAVMYLVNALSFEAKWENIYEENEVRDGIFTMEDGTEQEVAYMYSTENVYLEGENETGFLKYYEGGEYAFVGILPKEGITMDAYLEYLDGETLYELLESQRNESVEVSIPKFDMDYDAELSEVMCALGMTDAFDSSVADFTALGTYEGSNICIGRILHKTYLAVDEQGTVAGAATVVEMVEESAMVMENEVRLNRPFLYMIVDTETNTPLFIGVTTSM